DRGHLDRAGEAGGGAAQDTGGQDERADRQAGQPRRARVATDDAQRETVRRIADEHVHRDTEDDAEAEPPVDVEAGQVADHVDVADVRRRGLVEARGVSQRPLDDVIEERHGDVRQQQARDRLVDAPILTERAGQRNPQPADEHAEERHRDLHAGRRGAAQQMTYDGGGGPTEYYRSLTSGH